MTLIFASVVMVAVGLKGPGGMLAALIMGGVVCTALSVAGSFITDLKIGYWLGTTPKKQEGWKFHGSRTHQEMCIRDRFRRLKHLYRLACNKRIDKHRKQSED